jgi:hypothetical protein
MQAGAQLSALRCRNITRHNFLRTPILSKVVSDDNIVADRTKGETGHACRAYRPSYKYMFAVALLPVVLRSRTCRVNRLIQRVNKTKWIRGIDALTIRYS